MTDAGCVGGLGGRRVKRLGSFDTVGVVSSSKNDEEEAVEGAGTRGGEGRLVGEVESPCRAGGVASSIEIRGSTLNGVRGG